MYIKFFESYNKEIEIRDAAWLYMLVYPYKGQMNEKSWINDNRMGVNFLDSMKRLEEKYVYKEDEYWYSKNNAKQYLKNVFGTFKSLPDAENNSKFSEYNKYNTKDYTIGNIAYDIFKHEFKKNKNKIDLSLLEHDYNLILKWLKKYQRYGNSINNKLYRYIGLKNELFSDKEYTLYRGVKTNKDFIEKNNLKEGDFIIDKRLSWTESEKVATNFAKGRDNWMSYENLKGNERGIILKHTFDSDDIFLDLYWLDLNHPYFKEAIDFPDEHEVIVRPVKRKVKIHKIIYPENQ